MGWTRKEVGIVTVVTLVLLFFAIAALEIALPLLRPSPNQGDALLGWKLRTDLHRDFPQSTRGGKPYPARMDTNADGLRVFGTNANAPVRVLVLGDSFVADPYASDDRMWYARMVQRLAERSHRPGRDFYVFAGGGGGWGTYQQLLLSETLARKIEPDLLVLEFNSGDFINNLYEWERESVVRVQYMRRPFADRNGGGPRYASGLLAGIYQSFIGELRLFTRLDGLIGTIQAKRYGGSIRPLPPEVLSRYERESVSLTKILLTKLRDKYRGVPAIMVNSDGDQAGPNKVWKILARETGFIPLDAPADFLSSLTPDQRKDLINKDDQHLSDEGNQRFGTVVADELIKRNVLAMLKH